MTLLEINLTDVLSETDPDDRVLVWAPAFREGATGGLVGPRQKAIPLVDGVGSDEVVPGPLMVQVRCKAMSDTHPREVVVPEEGPVTLTGLLDSAGAFTYSPPVIGQVALDAQRAEDAAVRAEAVADSVYWQDDRLSVMGQLGPSLTGPKGDPGDGSGDGSGGGSGDVLWSELSPALDGKADVEHTHPEIDSALRDKADLVDGKVPTDQLPTALLTPTGGEPRTDNAAYLELDEFLSIFDGDVPAAVAALLSDGITQPLIDMGTVDGTGTLITPAAFDTAAGAFLDHVLTHDTGLRPIATINGTHWNGTNLTPAIRTKIASEALRMVWDYGFSGVQIDFEPYSTQIIDDALIPLLQEIRTTLPAQNPLSVALPTHRSGNITTTQIGQMAQVVDMLNPMIYDTLGPPGWGETTIQTAEEYQQLYRAEIDAYQTGIGAAAGKLVPIVPAYNDLSMPAGGGDPGFPDPNSGVIFYHLHEVENISVAMAAVHEAITIDGHAIDSLAVFWYPALYYAGFEADRAVWEGWVNPGGVTPRQLTDALAGKADKAHTHTVEQVSDLPEIRSSAIPDSLVLRSPTGNVLVANTPSGPSSATSRSYVESYVASQMGAAPVSHTHTAEQISDATSTGKSVMTATSAAAARTAIGAGTSSLSLGTTSSTAKAGNYQPTAANISDATTVGRSVLKAVDAAAARVAIGAGTSNLSLGTTSTTAKAGNWKPAVADVTGLSAALAVRSTSTVTPTGGTITLTAPASPVSGQMHIFEILPTASTTVTVSTLGPRADGVPASLTIEAGGVGLVGARWSSSKASWHVLTASAVK